MAENLITHLWYRRISETTIATSLIVLIFYFLPNLQIESIKMSGGLLTVSGLAAIFAGVTLAIGSLSLFWSSKRYPVALPLLCFSMVVATVATLIFSSGGLNSLFIALWVPAAIFAGVFNLLVLVIVALLPLCYLGWLFLQNDLTSPLIIVALLAGEIPPILSYFIFFRSAGGKEDNTYQRLVTEFSAVSNKSEAVINAITDGVIALNSQGIIELVNPAAQRIIGWDSHDALTLNYKSVLKLIDDKSQELPEGTDPISRVLTTNQELRTEDLTLITNSDKKILASLVVSPVGQPGSGVIVVFRDITKEKAEERGQAEFISTASHEMRTPVASIEGYLGLALNPATAQIDAKARDYIMKAHEVAQHLGRLFSDLLDVSKADDGRLSNNPKVVDVASFVQDIVESLRSKAEAKGLVLLYKPEPEEVEDKAARRLNPVFYANVDNDHLREIVSNLVENAIKYTPHGNVSVDVTGDDKHVVVSVQDTGIGIPTEDLPHLFQKFYRVDNSDTREIGGTGLGLYLSRRLAETIGGRIWAESKYHEGTTFNLEIPRISHPEAMELIETAATTTIPIVSVALAQEPTVPIATPLQTPAQPVPVVAPPTTPVPMPQPAPPRTPSLAVIERNPEQYLTRPNNTTLPPDSQNQP